LEPWEWNEGLEMSYPDQTLNSGTFNLPSPRGQNTRHAKQKTRLRLKESLKMRVSSVSPTSLQDYNEILFHVGLYNTVQRMAVYCFIWVYTNLSGELRCGWKITLLGEFNFISGYTTVFGKFETLL
jgi:hypothetical protein